MNVLNLLSRCKNFRVNLRDFHVSESVVVVEVDANCFKVNKRTAGYAADTPC